MLPNSGEGFRLAHAPSSNTLAKQNIFLIGINLHVGFVSRQFGQMLSVGLSNASDFSTPLIHAFIDRETML